MKYRAEIFTGNGYHNKHVASIQANTIPTLKRKASRICNGYFNVYDRMEIVETEIRTDIDGNTIIIEYSYAFRRFNKKTPNNTFIRRAWE